MAIIGSKELDEYAVCDSSFTAELFYASLSQSTVTYALAPEITTVHEARTLGAYVGNGDLIARVRAHAI